MKRFRSIIPFLSLPVLLCTGCKHDSGMAAKESTPFAVSIQTVTARHIASKHSYTGTLVESQSIQLSFLTVGTVEKVLVAEGEKVKKGQVLAILQSTNARSLLAAAMAKEKQAQDAYDRFTSVYKSGSLQSVKMVEMETNLQQAKSSREIAEKSLADCTISAPADGIIGRRMVEPGMNAAPEIPVLTLVKIDRLHAKIAVPEAEITNITEGQQAEVSIDAFDDAAVNGTVTGKSVIADPLSRTYAVRILIDNVHERYRPGMACTVRPYSADTLQSVVVPQYAVLKGAGGAYCYVTDTGKSHARKRPVIAGSLTQDGIIILGGLAEGDYIITEGIQKLADGTPVAVR